MNTTYSDVLFNRLNCKVTVDEPNECPSCKHSIKPSILHRTIIEDDNSEPYFYVVYLCNHCRNPFICRFSNLTKSTVNVNYLSFENLDFTAPKKFTKCDFEDCIKNISPTFITIYNQALEAEHYNLNEIAGIGYRKALEFLIKDFLISHESKEESKVKSTSLGCCIETMIDNPQLKIVASRATWLGNDQTHYEQKYTDNDINDLKRLIELSVHWISIICLTDEAELIEKK